MTYDWEKEAKRYIRDMQCHLPEHLQIVGVALENVDTGEGALVERNHIKPELYDVTEADIWQDILVDAKSQYERVYHEVFKK